MDHLRYEMYQTVGDWCLSCVTPWANTIFETALERGSRRAYRAIGYGTEEARVCSRI